MPIENKISSYYKFQTLYECFVSALFVKQNKVSELQSNKQPFK